VNLNQLQHLRFQTNFLIIFLKKSKTKETDKKEFEIGKLEEA
jgi:hypothetical protein